MPSFTRVEFSVDPSLRSLRVVLLIAFPDEVLQQMRKGKTSSEVEAYRIALEAIRALHFGSVRGDMTFISSTPGKIKKSRLANLIILPKTAAAPGSSKNLEAIAGCPLDVVFARQASLLYRRQGGSWDLVCSSKRGRSSGEAFLNGDRLKVGGRLSVV
jgi:hypothetical protein